MVSLQLEYVALSFVRDASDVESLRTVLMQTGSTSKIIAKIERVEALENLSAIVAAADAVMVARGDLRDAVPFETLPYVQATIVKECNHQGKPVIVATEMLTSMIAGDRPSCADVADITTAVLGGASATMLSNETAAGNYPVQTVAVMRQVINEAARHVVAQPVSPRL